MLERRKPPVRICPAIAMAAVLFATGGSCIPVMAQDAPKERATTAAQQLVAKLRAACERELKLRGVFVEADEPKGSLLSLKGTIDRREQASVIEAEAKRLLEETPSWKTDVPAGVSASKMIVFPIRSDVLPKLRADMAKAAAPAANPGLFRQTRIDDLYFDGDGCLRVDALCINQRAYLARKNPAAFPKDDPAAEIRREVHKRLQGYPLPENVDRKLIADLRGGRLRFEPSPARLLQQFANEAKLDDIVFRDASFDAKGELIVDGLLGGEKKDERALAASLAARPEVASVYARPSAEPAMKPADVVAPMSVAPWRTTLLAAVQKRFADDANSKGSLSILRHCRIDRARFACSENVGLSLTFEFVVLVTGKEQVAVGTHLMKASKELITFPFDVDPIATRLKTPLPELRQKVASTRALDGVRLDDLVFGPTGKPTLVGRWIGSAQAETIDVVLVPLVEEHTKGKVTGPLEKKLIALPSDRLLKSLRKRLLTSPNETSLDRLFFRPAADQNIRPEIVLQGATLETTLTETKSHIEEWLSADELARDVGTAVVELTPRSRSLLTELRKLVAGDTALDGVLVKSASFDEENNLVLTGRQDRDGQAQGAIALIPKAAAVAWKGLRAPKAAAEGAFAVFPLASLLKDLSSKLQSYSESDGVMLTRAYYDEKAELVLAGRASRRSGDYSPLERRIKMLIGDDADIKLASLALEPEEVDAEQKNKIVGKGVDALAGGNLASFPLSDLDEVVFLAPKDSMAWYLRGAYYYLSRDQALAKRDLGRARALEKKYPSLDRDRRQILERFQGPLRTTLEELMEASR